MNIAISGASGFIGTHLSAYLDNFGHHIIPLKHVMFRDEMEGELQQIINHCDVVINLAGASLNHRWTSYYQKELVHSRVETTGRLVKAIRHASVKPSLFISVSAVGYYPAEDKVFDEATARKGEGFLADLCHLWEAEARKCPPETRLVITRLGVVLSPDGGAMEQMLRPLKMLRVGAAIAPGTQPLPWVDMRDVCHGMEFLINHPEIHGVVNLVAPDLISHNVFSLLLSHNYGGIATFTIPQWILQVILGKGAEYLTKGQQVYPAKMLDSGYQFKTPTIKRFFKTINI